MTARRFDRMAFALLGVLVIALGAVAYGSPRRAESTAASAPHQHAEPAAREDARDGGFSIGDLTGTWRDQAGRERSVMGDDDGRLTIVTMAYTSCTVSCPRLIADLKRIEGVLAGPQRAKVEFVMVSLDPARDTPGRLAEFARSLHLDPARWALLTGTDADVRELAAALRVRYVTEANGEVSHTNRIVVLDPTGTPIHWQAGIGSGVDGTVRAIEAALAR
jgi:protein SCO1/2